MKFAKKAVVDGKDVFDGILVGRVVKEPKILEGREGKQDVAYVTVVNNAPNTPVYFEVTIIGDLVKKAKKLVKGKIVSIKGEFGEKEHEGKKTETLLASAVESF